jgi:hypothetical protein
MPSCNLAHLLKLPAERAEIAMAPWESLTDQEVQSARQWYEEQRPGLRIDFAKA